MPPPQPQHPPPLQREAWHALSVESVAAALSSDLAAGLSRAEAAGRLAAAGPNLLPEGAPRRAAPRGAPPPPPAAAAPAPAAPLPLEAGDVVAADPRVVASSGLAAAE